MLYDFFIKHPVFTFEEFNAFHANKKTCGRRAAESLLAYYNKAGKIQRLKRGLFAVVPPGENAAQFTPDPFLVAGRMSKDAVLVHHTALEFHGRAYSVFNHFTYQTSFAVRPLVWRNVRFNTVPVPAQLQRKKQVYFGVTTAERNGMEVKVTSLERTFVDVLDCPRYSGSWEEIWRSLESVEFFDLEQVLKYLKILSNATTAAKAGFFLEQNKDRLMVSDKYLASLQKLCPKQPHYLNRKKRNGRLSNKWKLIIPDEILNQQWKEIS
ncbi:MAG: putative transcriptional regulator [Candidatus Uhrbacteria bacterium GW2011_GWF2_39_13]|uniref:Putative transcriptional regulator n=1 Tax=Candidatus Uhrbacteria bacterium GW2011_GWF2_39_13 TaxID=1618995 RepID=A0A0G0Q1S0_9BACT|nr:MAG: putative transcriptional regulator [Candidatus Uhrbacteria bacterium GW2011_GWF2_39_13]